MVGHSTIFNNTKDFVKTQEQLKQSAKEIIPSLIRQDSSFSEFLEDEKLIFAFILYGKVRIHISNGMEIKTSLELFIKSFMEICLSPYHRLKGNFPDKFATIKNEIKKKKLILEDLPQMEDIFIDEMLNLESSYISGESTTDEVFSTRLFINDNDVIIAPNKVRNLKKLYDTIIYPILIYYKMKLNTRRNILIINKGLSKGTTIQERGQAVIFSLAGVEKSIIFNDIQSGKIDVDFGILKLEEDGVFISIPFMLEGKMIRNYIVT